MTTDYTADANCRGAWLFADNLNDASGDGNTLTANDAADYQATRPTGYTTGKSLHLDGSDDDFYRTFGDLSNNFPGKGGFNEEDFAFGFWFKKDTDQAVDSTPITFGQYAGARVYFDISHSTKLEIRIRDSNDDANAWSDIGDGFGGDTSWYHILFSFDGSAKTGTIWISSESAFGDMLDGSTHTFTNVDNIRGNTSNFCIGGDDPDCINFDGYIYQPIVFNRTLSAAEAEEIYTNGINGAEGAVANILLQMLQHHGG